MWARAPSPDASFESVFEMRSECRGEAPPARQGIDGAASATPRQVVRSRRYCLITPCRDEAIYASRTLDAVTRQTEPPARWIIVDDGSKDSTPQILAEYAARFPYIRIVSRPDRGIRKLGGGVIDAFYSGYDTVDPSEFDYICKFDLDLDIPPRYFELMMDWMEACPRIGTCSGKPYFHPNGVEKCQAQFPLKDVSALVSERCGDQNSVGQIKFYRTTCFEQIGGFVREVMWDGIDGHRCRQLGWLAIASDHPQVRFIHLRPMGTSHKSWLTGRARHGYGQYFMGTTPVYMLASALSRMWHPPVVLGGLAMLYGYFKSMRARLPRYGEAEFRRMLRRYQWDCLIRGKSRATARLDAKQAAMWDPGVRSASGAAASPRRHTSVPVLESEEAAGISRAMARVETASELIAHTLPHSQP
jgi:glycosyltransferase involved in cell wall biosynthesis